MNSHQEYNRDVKTEKLVIRISEMTAKFVHFLSVCYKAYDDSPPRDFTDVYRSTRLNRIPTLVVLISGTRDTLSLLLHIWQIF